MNEIKRMHILQKIVEQHMTASQASELLGLSLRQVRRLIAKYRQQGASGVVHGNRGRAPSNRIKQDVQSKILELAENEYRDYNDCHFTDELAEKHGIQLSRSSVRRIRRQAKLKSPRKRRPPRYRSRRKRREQAGMLLQTDGSRHNWLEGRGPWLTLIAYIDDAAMKSPERFRDEEDAGYFLGLQEICLQKASLVQSCDQHTIFQASKATLDKN